MAPLIYPSDLSSRWLNRLGVNSKWCDGYAHLILKGKLKVVVIQALKMSNRESVCLQAPVSCKTCFTFLTLSLRNSETIEHVDSTYAGMSQGHRTHKARFKVCNQIEILHKVLLKLLRLFRRGLTNDFDTWQTCIYFNDFVLLLIKY